jgi:hypothetical protein
MFIRIVCICLLVHTTSQPTLSGVYPQSHVTTSSSGLLSCERSSFRKLFRDATNYGDVEAVILELVKPYPGMRS